MIDRHRPQVIVTSDSHIGPPLELLRPYCPRKHLEAFDLFAAKTDAAGLRFGEFRTGYPEWMWNLQTQGHHDAAARLADMDADGVSAEVIFHGSQNGAPIPFREGSFGQQAGQDLTLAEVGNQIYNRWLSDFVSHEPARHVGLAYLPMWDVEAAVECAREVRDLGLRGINFPAMQASLLEYNDPRWDPFWSVCEEYELPLCTHSGSASPAGNAKGPGHELIRVLDSTGWYSRRAIHWMALGGVFERHPRLRLVMVEQPGNWWPAQMLEMDSLCRGNPDSVELPTSRLPSDYCRECVFMGASFMSRMEAGLAIAGGYSSNVIWGSDYPHMEGTYQFPRKGDEEPMTHLALRNTFHGLPPDEVQAMIGGNGIRVFGLDEQALRDVAERIGAPSLAEIDEPLETVPAKGGRLAFRTDGPWS